MSYLLYNSMCIRLLLVVTMLTSAPYHSFPHPRFLWILSFRLGFTSCNRPRDYSLCRFGWKYPSLPGQRLCLTNCHEKKSLLVAAILSPPFVKSWVNATAGSRRFQFALLCPDCSGSSIIPDIFANCYFFFAIFYFFLQQKGFPQRRHPDLNWGIKVLQTSALPLGYGATF